VGLLKD